MALFALRNETEADLINKYLCNMEDHQETLRLDNRLGNWQNSTKENKGKPFVFSSENTTWRYPCRPQVNSTNWRRGYWLCIYSVFKYKNIWWSLKLEGVILTYQEQRFRLNSIKKAKDFLIRHKSISDPGKEMDTEKKLMVEQAQKDGIEEGMAKIVVQQP